MHCIYALILTLFSGQKVYEYVSIPCPKLANISWAFVCAISNSRIETYWNLAATSSASLKREVKAMKAVYGQ